MPKEILDHHLTEEPPKPMSREDWVRRYLWVVGGVSFVVNIVGYMGGAVWLLELLNRTGIVGETFLAFVLVLLYLCGSGLIFQSILRLGLPWFRKYSGRNLRAKDITVGRGHQSFGRRILWSGAMGLVVYFAVSVVSALITNCLYSYYNLDIRLGFNDSVLLSVSYFITFFMILYYEIPSLYKHLTRMVWQREFE